MATKDKATEAKNTSAKESDNTGTKKPGAKKPGAKKPVAKKTVTKKPVAKNPGAKKAAKSDAPPRHAPQKPAALTVEEQNVILALQEELGINAGQRPNDDDEFRRVLAYHEAGHAVVGHVLGRKLRAVSVGHHCEFEPMAVMSGADRENSIKIALAGPYAEAHASKDDVSVGAGADLPRAREVAKKLADDDWKACLERLSTLSLDLVLTHWAMIERVAEQLIQPAGTMRERDLVRLFQGDKNGKIEH